MKRPNDPRLLLEQIVELRDGPVATLQDLIDRVQRTAAAAQAFAQRIRDDLDSARAALVTTQAELYKARVVDALPTSAPGGQLIVKAGDTNVYVGTGLTTPLRRIATQALP